MVLTITKLGSVLEFVAMTGDPISQPTSEFGTYLRMQDTRWTKLLHKRTNPETLTWKFSSYSYTSKVLMKRNSQSATLLVP